MFLQNVYPKLKAFYWWWKSNRTAKEGSLILSYGATIDRLNNPLEAKSIFQAAAWESGMDNAPRFLSSDLNFLKKYDQSDNQIAYLLNRINVDLNTFYYFDILHLEKISRLLKYDKEAVLFKKEAQYLKNFINEKMWDLESSFYYDINTSNYQLLTKEGSSIETFLPLFAKLSEDFQAAKMINKISVQNYNAYFPFPSLPLDHKSFCETNYWAGPVWLDFQYFAIQGIYNYDHHKGKYFRDKVLNFFYQKFLHEDTFAETLRENYNAINGQGLATTNFSWSARALAPYYYWWKILNNLKNIKTIFLKKDATKGKNERNKRT